LYHLLIEDRRGSTTASPCYEAASLRKLQRPTVAHSTPAWPANELGSKRFVDRATRHVRSNSSIEASEAEIPVSRSHDPDATWSEWQSRRVFRQEITSSIAEIDQSSIANNKKTKCRSRAT
jgi:hypothetical protein